MEAAWRSRSPFERWMYVGIAILGITMTIAIIVVISLQKRPEIVPSVKERVPKICVNPTCLREAAYINNTIDSTLNPCVNFYKFVCGKVKGDAFSTIREKIKTQFVSLYREPLQKDDHNMVKAMKILYELCLEETRLTITELNNVDRIKQEIKALGGWPMLEGSAWDETKFDWTRTTHNLRDRGYNFSVFLDLSVTIHPSITSQHIFKISLPEPEVVNKENMMDVAVMLGADKAHAEVEVQELNIFVKQLLELIRGQLDNEDVYPVRTIFLYQRPPLFHPIEFDLLKFINKLLPSTAQVLERDYILSISPEKMGNWLNFIFQKPKKVVANFMIWHAIKEIANDLGVTLTSSQNQESITVSQNTTNQMEYCLDKIHRRFVPNPIDVLYVKKHAPNYNLHQVRQLATNVKEEYLELLRTAEWLDPTYKDEFIQKVRDVHLVIGAPEKYINGQILDELNVEMRETNEDDFLSLLKRLKRNYLNFSYNLINKPVAKAKFDQWNLIEAAEVITNVTHARNVILIPATILQGEMYNPKRPNYLNYATLGKVVVKELLAYDNYIEKIDNYLRNNDLYIYVVQYMEQLLSIRGCAHTQGLAAGYCTNTTFSAYKKWEQDQGKESQLPGVNYTNDQLFWIYSVPLCSESLNNRNDRFLDQMAMRNPDFAKAFNCPWGPIQFRKNL